MMNQVQEIFTLTLGLIIEAFPFIVLGVAISIFIGSSIKDSQVLKYLPKNKFISHLTVGLFGIFMPVCECGNIPVARKLISKKFTVSQAVTFLLAAPIVNPITFITTLEAFNIDTHIAFMRIILGYAVAVLIGLLFSLKKDQNVYLEKEFYNETCSVDNHSESKGWFASFEKEFILIFKMLFIGAFIAALVQVFVPREIITSVGEHPVYSIIAMLLLGLIVSMCSNVDAFFALSYSTSFTLGSLMTFMIFGPMIDIKILFMLKKTFTNKFLLQLSLLVATASIIIGFAVNILYRNFL